MPLALPSVFPDWVLWILTIEAALVGVAFVAAWFRNQNWSLAGMVAGWIAVTALVFAFTLVLVFIVIPILAVLIVVVIGVLLLAAIAWPFRQRFARD